MKLNSLIILKLSTMIIKLCKLSNGNLFAKIEPFIISQNTFDHKFKLKKIDTNLQ